MTNFKKVSSVLMACATFLSIQNTGKSYYQLNEDVIDPPAALQLASQIGILHYSNPNFVAHEDKDAIVVLSFGTTYKENRAKTIEATVKEIQNAHPNIKVATAFTSHIIIDHIKKNEGRSDYLTPEQTLEKLKREGYTRIALVSLDIIPGIEYKYDVQVFHEYKTQFKKMVLGTPLMYWHGQGQDNLRDDVLQTLRALNLPSRQKNTAILLMAHGTPDPANAYYSVMKLKLNQLGRDDVQIYTIEGWPRLEEIIKELKSIGTRKVILMPFMMVAGDHANNDMAGEEENSHKVILKKEGFEVETRIQGLGENKNIRDIFLERANETWNALIYSPN